MPVCPSVRPPTTRLLPLLPNGYKNKSNYILQILLFLGVNVGVCKFVLAYRQQLAT